MNILHATTARELLEKYRRETLIPPLLEIIGQRIREAAGRGDPGINLTRLPERERIPVLDSLDLKTRDLLVDEIRKLGYSVTVSEGGGPDQRDTGSFLINWENAKEPHRPSRDDVTGRCPHCKLPWEGDTV